MPFEFEVEKSHANKRKHEIDFDEAQALWADPNRVVFVARFHDEERQGVVARHDGRLWCAIYTHRAENIMIISVRRARDYEEKLYNNV